MLLGLVTNSERTIVRSLSATKPNSSIPKPGQDIPCRSAGNGNSSHINHLSVRVLPLVFIVGARSVKFIARTAETESMAAAIDRGSRYTIWGRLSVVRF